MDISIIDLLASDKELISYRPKFAKAAGGILQAILLQQILYWYKAGGYKPFYKFKEPCDNGKYRAGDSWTESLGFTRYEFDKALASFGQKISKSVGKDPAALVWYWTGLDRLTYYEVNIAALDNVVRPLFVTQHFNFTQSDDTALHTLYVSETNSSETNKTETTDKAFHPVPRGTGGASKAAGKSAIGRREPTEAELALLPCFEACQQAIAKARDDLGLSPATQERDRALIVLEQTTRLNGYSAEQIQRACEWCFGPDCPSREFNLGNLSFIHRWRKKWANGLAVVCMIDKYNRRQTADNRPKLYTPEVVAPQYVFPNRQLGVIKL